MTKNDYINRINTLKDIAEHFRQQGRIEDMRATAKIMRNLIKDYKNK